MESGYAKLHYCCKSIVLGTHAEKMRRLSLELILVALLWAQRGCAQSAIASVSPLAFNASQGSVTTFHCSVTNAFALLWRIDNIVFSAGENRLLDRGIMFPESVEVSRGSYQSNLTIPATPENDGSVVQCLAVAMVGTNMFSLNATYRVQGSGLRHSCISLYHYTVAIFLYRYTGSPQ